MFLPEGKRGHAVDRMRSFKGKKTRAHMSTRVCMRARSTPVRYIAEEESIADAPN